MVDAARLRRTGDISLVRTAGSAWTDPCFTVRAHLNDLGIVRVAVSARREVGTIVRRNRVRRRLREAVRRRLRQLDTTPGIDLVLVARPAAHDATSSDLEAAVERALLRLVGGGSGPRRRNGR